MNLKFNTIPNWITLSRLILFVVIVAGILTGGSETKQWLLPIYVIVFLMDKLDGWVARNFQMTSEFGVVLDRMVDKIIVTVMGIICVFYLGHLTLLVLLAINQSRDIVVSNLRQFMTDKNKKLPIDFLGKLKFFFENLGIILFVVKISNYNFFETRLVEGIILFWGVSAALGIYSLGRYVRQLVANK